jgi:hypothetical protein
MSALDATISDRPCRGRRLSWREFYALRPDLKADNDNAVPRDLEGLQSLRMNPILAMVSYKGSGAPLSADDARG